MNKKISAIFAVSFAGLLVVAGVLAFLAGKTQTPGHTLNVVASENMWGSIASQIGGDNVQVTSVISDPQADPHLYESGAKDASAIASADVVIVNGLGYDDFMDKLLGASPNQNRVEIRIADVLGAKDGDNPHLWYDINRVGIVAAEMQKQFAAKDAAHRGAYQTNYDHFMDSLQPLVNEIKTIRTNFPDAPVGYTERVPGYLLQDAGLSVLTPPGFASAIEDGNEPSPADQTAMLDLLTGKKIRALLYNSQASSAVTQHIREVAVQNGVPVVPVTETIPTTSTTYQTWQKSQLDALAAALDETK